MRRKTRKVSILLVDIIVLLFMLSIRTTLHPLRGLRLPLSPSSLTFLARAFLAPWGEFIFFTGILVSQRKPLVRVSFEFTLPPGSLRAWLPGCFISPLQLFQTVFQGQFLPSASRFICSLWAVYFIPIFSTQMSSDFRQYSPCFLLCSARGIKEFRTPSLHNHPQQQLYVPGRLQNQFSPSAFQEAHAQEMGLPC